MGGFGSTRWAQHVKKTPVESCLRLGINDMMRGGLDPYRSETAFVRWESMWTGREHASIAMESQGGMLWFRYTVRDGGYAQNLRCGISLVSTTCHFGGVRWWFRCPRCTRRVGNLYIAPYNGHLQCRTCHDLVYASAQTAHSDDRGHVIRRAFALMEKHAKLTRKLERCKRWSKRKRRLYGKYVEVFNEIRLIGSNE